MSTVKKKDSVERDLQIAINSKNARISELEVANSRQQVLFEHAKEIGDKQLKARERDKPNKPKEITMMKLRLKSVSMKITVFAGTKTNVDITILRRLVNLIVS